MKKFLVTASLLLIHPISYGKPNEGNDHSHLLSSGFLKIKSKIESELKPHVVNEGPGTKSYQPKVRLLNCVDFQVRELDPDDIQIAGVCIYLVTGYMREEPFVTKVHLKGKKLTYDKPVSQGNYMP